MARPLALALVAVAVLAGGHARAEGEGDCPAPGSYFAGVPKIEYEGPRSTNPFAFRYYNRDEIVLGKSMKDWLRFSVAFWHTMRGDGSDPFGSPTKSWPWEDPAKSPLEMAKVRMEVFFELLQRLGVDYWCFHDRDIAPEGATLQESNAMLDEVALLAEDLQAKTGIRPLWGTAQLFKHPRYMHGAATNPDAQVFAFAAAQVKKAMEVTARLGGANYVFWGGREGYKTLLNTDLGAELSHLGSFMQMAAKYKQKLGFTGNLLLEPKPQEPTKHQYDWDVGTTAGFLQRYDLLDHFKINIECNHATLSGHSCEHEVEMARVLGVLGNIDANQGDAQTGWDTDQVVPTQHKNLEEMRSDSLFLTDPRTAAGVMLSVVRNGGLAPGGFNFDAKLHRESTDVEDLVLAHVAGMDALARGLRAAAKLAEDGRLDASLAARYSSYRSTDLGRAIDAGEVSFEELERAAMAEGGDPASPPPGKQELYELLFDQSVDEAARG